jgi:hypothetical protein
MDDQLCGFTQSVTGLPPTYDRCWDVWHEILNLIGKGDNLEWRPLFMWAIEEFPESKRYQAKLSFEIYSWYEAGMDCKIRVFREIERFAALGVPWAVCKMGSAYYHGLVVGRDWNKAYDWFSRAAKADQAEAQCRLAGLIRLTANDDDMRTALDLYLRVAAKSFSAWRKEARLTCAEIYAFGVGVPEDPWIARYLIEPMVADIDHYSDSDRSVIRRTADRVNKQKGTNLKSLRA